MELLIENICDSVAKSAFSIKYAGKWAGLYQSTLSIIYQNLIGAKRHIG